MKQKKLLFGSMLLLIVVLVFQTGYAQIEKNVKIRKMGKPALGVMITDPGAELLEQHGLDGGALVRKVLKESEAEKIGLQKNDIIIKFDSKGVESAGQLKDLVTGFESEKTVDITVNRDGNIRSLKAHLKPSEELKWTDEEDVTIHLNDKMHGPDSHVFFKKKMHGSDKGGFLGVHAENLSDQLLKYFEVKHGVLIEKVIEDSPAEKADLKAGDVITEIEGKEVKDYADLIRILNYHDPEDKIKVTFTRKGKSKNTDVTLAKKTRDLTWIDEGDEDERIVIKPGNEKKRIIVKKKGEPGEMMELDVMEHELDIDVPQKGERVEVEIFVI